jgi:predicted phage baseplate assembly protein
VTGRVVEVWVRWRERTHLLDAGPDDRAYTLERIGGMTRFGDGRRGRIPPAGAPVSVSFATGGGVNGNAPPGAISEARAAVPFLGGVTNPRPARGGSDAEAIEATRARGAQRVRHRGQALAASDFEWLAVEASPAVARARCLPTTGPAGAGQRGWVTVVIVPHGRERQPQPDGELTGRVRVYLAARASAAVAARIRVIGPKYRAVGVIAAIVPMRPEDAVGLEAVLRARLDEFLHPLRGGPEGRGWQVGEGVPISQVAALIESTPGVAFAREIVLSVGDAVFREDAPGAPEELVAPGGHQLRLTLGGKGC